MRTVQKSRTLRTKNKIVRGRDKTNNNIFPFTFQISSNSTRAQKANYNVRDKYQFEENFTKHI